MRRLILFLTLICLSLVSVHGIFAAATWVGGTKDKETSWNEPENWLPNSIPTTNENINIPVVPNGHYPELSSNYDTGIWHITIDKGAKLSTKGFNLTSSTGMLTNNGTLIFSGTESQFISSEYYSGSGETHVVNTSGNVPLLELLPTKVATLKVDVGSSTLELSGATTVSGDFHLLDGSTLKGGDANATFTVSGKSYLHGTITSLANIEYKDRVFINGTTTIDTTAKILKFGSAIDSVSNNPQDLPQSLTLKVKGPLDFSHDVGSTNSIRDLTINASGAVTQGSGKRLTIVGHTNIKADDESGTSNTPQAITLNLASNNFNSLEFYGSDVKLKDANNLLLNGASAATNLTINASGTVTQSAGTTLTVSKHTDITAINNSIPNSTPLPQNITLAETDNDFKTITFKGNIVSLSDTNVLELTGDSTAKNLTIKARDNVDQTGGSLIVDSHTLIAANNNVHGTNQEDKPKDIVMNQPKNNFNTITFTGSDVTLQDANALELTGISTAKSLLIKPLGNVTQKVGKGNQLTVSGHTDIWDQNSTPKITITLNGPDNDFNTITFTGSEVTLQDINPLALKGDSTAKNLTIKASSVNQQNVGSLKVSGDTDITAADYNDTPQFISLPQDANDLKTITFKGSIVTLQDSDALVLDGTSTATNLTINAKGAVTQSANGTLTVSGDVNITASGAVTQSAGTTGTTTLTVSGNTNITAKDGSTLYEITLTQADNDFKSVVFDGSNIDLRDKNALVLSGTEDSKATGNLTVNASDDVSVSGALTIAETLSISTVGDVSVSDTVTAKKLSINASGAVTQTKGSLTISGHTEITANDGSTSQIITLNQASNNFNTITFKGSNVTLQDSNALEFSNAPTATNLTINAAGAITQSTSSTLTVSGHTDITATKLSTKPDTANTPQNITLDEAGNNFKTVTFNGSNVTLRNSNALVFSSASTATNLTTNAKGAVTQSTNSTLTVSGHTEITANDGSTSQTITLDEAGNNFKTVTFNGSKITLRDSDALAFNGTSTATELTINALGAVNQSEGKITVSGDTNITASGAVTQSTGTTLTVTGDTNITANDKSEMPHVPQAITLIQASNDFNTVLLFGSDIDLQDKNALELSTTTASNGLAVGGSGDVSVSGSVTVGWIFTISTKGNLSVSDTVTAKALIIDALGTVTQNVGGSFTVSGVTSITANDDSKTPHTPQNITLDEVGNNFTAVAFKGSNVTLRNSKALALNGTSTATELTINASGAVTQSTDSTLTVSGDTNITASGAVTQSTGSTLTVSGDTNITASGAVTQSTGSTLTVSGHTSITANDGSTPQLITFDQSSNNFKTVTFNGSNVTLQDSDALVLDGTSTATNLTINAKGAVTQSTGTTTLTVSGHTSITANDGSTPQLITFDQASHNFKTVTFNGSNVTLRDSDALVLDGTSTATELTINAKGAVTQSTDSTLTVSGDTNITASGAVTQSTGSTLTVSGHTSITANDGSTPQLITFDQSSNNFNTVTFNGSNVTLQDSNALMLDGTSTATNLTINAKGAVTQSSGTTTLTVSGHAEITANDGNTAQPITLNQADNNFNTVALNGSSVSLNDTNALKFSGTSIVEHLSITVSGAVTQGKGQLTVLNLMSISAEDRSATPQDVTLDQATNNFNIVSFKGSKISLSEADDLVFGGLSTATELTINVAGGITQTRGTNLTVSGHTDITASNNITLNQTSNDFTTVLLNGSNVTIRDRNALELSGTGGSKATGNLAVNASGEVSISGAVTVGETFSISTRAGVSVSDTVTAKNLIISASGAVTQSKGSLTISGDTEIQDSTNNLPHVITLNQVDNDFNSIMFRGSEVTIQDSNALVIKDSSTATELTINAKGAVTQFIGSTLTVSGHTSITANDGSTPQLITFDQASNNFKTVTFNGSNVTLQDSDALVLDGTSTATNLTINAKGAVTQSANGTLTVSGDMNITAKDGSTLYEITLTQADNDFKTVVFDGSNIDLRDKNALVLSGTSTARELTINASGAVTQTKGSLTISGHTEITANDGSTPQIITLNQASNNFNTITFKGSNVTLQDSNALVLDGTSTATNLTINAAGAVTQSTGTTTLTVSGHTDITATKINPQSIVLNQPGNDFTTVLLNGSIVIIRDRNALEFSGTGGSKATGNLAVNASGEVSISGAVTVDETFSISTTAGVSVSDTVTAKNLIISASGAVTQSKGSLTISGDTEIQDSTNNLPHVITLNQVDNDFNSIMFRGSEVTIQDSNALVIKDSSTATELTINASGAVTQSSGSTLTVSGHTSITAKDGSTPQLITFDQASNNFKTVTFNGSNVTLQDSNALVLDGTSTATNLTINAAGAVTQSTGTTTLTVSGNTNITATNGSTLYEITLTQADNDLNTVTFKGSNVTLQDSNALEFSNAPTATNLTINAAGAVTQSASGTLTVSGHMDITANDDSTNTPQAITFSNFNNDFTTISFHGSDVAFRDINDLEFTGTGTSKATGNLDVTGTGNALVSGAMTVDGHFFFFIGGNFTQSDGAVSAARLNIVCVEIIQSGGSLTVSGYTSITTTGRVTLGQANNDFNAISFFSLSAITVTLRDSNALTIGTFQGEDNELTNGLSSLSKATLDITASGDVLISDAVTVAQLTIKTSGAVTQPIGSTNSLIVSGHTDITANDDSNTPNTPKPITLNQVGNDFNTVSFNGSDVTLQDVKDLWIGDSSTSRATGSFLATTGQNFVLGNRDMSAAQLTINASGSIGQFGGSFTVSGHTDITANDDSTTTPQVITLNHSGNDFNTISFNGSNIAIQDANALVFSDNGGTTDSSATGDLKVTTGGNFSQSDGAVSAATLTILASGTVTQSGGSLTVSGHANITANDDSATPDTLQAITLNQAANDFDTVSFEGSNVSLRDTNALALGTTKGTAAATGTLTVTTGGAAGDDLTDSGTITVGDLTTLTLGAGGNAVLDDPGNNFNTVTVPSGVNLTLVDINTIQLNAITITNNLDITAVDINQNTSLTIPGTLSFSGNWNLNRSNLNTGGILDGGTSNLIASDAETIIVNGDFQPDTITAADSNVEFSGVNPGSVGNATGGYIFNNLYFDKSITTNALITATNNWTIRGHMELSQGRWVLGDNTHTINGEWNGHTAPNFDFDSTGSTVIFSGGVAIMGIQPGQSFNNIVINKDRGALLVFGFTNNVQVDGNFTVNANSGRVALRSDVQIGGNLTVNADSGGIETGSNTILISGDWDYDSTASINTTNSTVIFDTGTSSLKSGGHAFHNLVIRDSVVNASAEALTVGNNLTIEDDGATPTKAELDYSTTSGLTLEVGNDLIFTKTGAGTDPATPILNLGSNALSVGNDYNAMITDRAWPAADEMGRLRLTGAPTSINRPYTAVAKLGIVEYYGSNATVQNHTEGSGNAHFWHLIINSGSNLTLEQDIWVYGHSGTSDGVLTEPVEETYPNEEDLMGIHIRGTGSSLDLNGKTLTLYGSLYNAGDDAAFVQDSGTVKFLGDFPAFIAGNNTFFNIEINNQNGGAEDVGGKIVYFQKSSTTTIADDTGATMKVLGDYSNGLQPEDPLVLPDSSQWVYLISSESGEKWIFDKRPSSTMTLEYVYIRNSDASPQPQVVKGSVGIEKSIGWLVHFYVKYSQTQDSDADGKIDQILVTSYAAMKRKDDGAYDGLTITVDGYEVIEYDDGPEDTEFYIRLKEQEKLDTGATPPWRITGNTTLLDAGKTDTPLTLDPSKSEELPYDDAPPIIGYTLAVAESSRNEVFIHFSEPIADTNGGGWENNFNVASLTNSGGNISVKVVTPTSGGLLQEALIDIGGKVTIDDIYENRGIVVSDVEDVATPKSNLTVDKDDLVDVAQALVDNTHRVSDIALGVLGNGIIQPVGATNKSLSAGGAGLTDFDGSDFLEDQDINIQAHLRKNIQEDVHIYWDNSVTSAHSSNGFWLPPFTEKTGPNGNFSGLVPQASTTAETGSMRAVSGSNNLYEYDWEAEDSKIVNGLKLEFLFHLIGPNLYAAWCTDETASNWYQNIRPWSFQIRNILAQAGTVSILNNIIRPTHNEVTSLRYKISNGGTVTIQVFDLAGGLVEILQRGYQEAGDYAVSWNGQNRAGNAVARGIYFIRFVGPDGIDQIRKVLVVR